MSETSLQMKTELEFRPFQKEDFPEYLNWFKDENLNQQLGPMEEDDEWLRHVLEEQQGLTIHKGCTYSVFQNNTLLSVIGIICPDENFNSYVITSFAVKPDSRSKGIGTKAINQLLKLHPLQDGESWKAYLNQSNPRARSFFEKNGWKCIYRPMDSDDMYLYEKK